MATFMGGSYTNTTTYMWTSSSSSSWGTGYMPLSNLNKNITYEQWKDSQDLSLQHNNFRAQDDNQAHLDRLERW